MRLSRFLAAGLFVATVVLMVEAQQPRPGQFAGGGGIGNMVLNNKVLQEELKVTDAQKEKLKVLADKQAENFTRMFSAFKDAAGDKDKIKEIVENNKKAGEKLQEEIKKGIDETLTADQKKRLKQIERQVAGPGAFLAEDNAKELNLTDSQKGKIKTVMDEYRKDMQDMSKDAGGSFKDGKFTFDKEKLEANQKKREKLTKATLADIDDILTDEQRKLWKEMTGEKFDTAKLFQGFGGFGGFPQPKGKSKE